jgi:hypothetical protein
VFIDPPDFFAFQVCSSSSSSADLLSDNNEPEVKISVKERTQRFNKMASEVDLQRGNNSSNNSNNRRDHKPKVRFFCFRMSRNVVTRLVIVIQKRKNGSCSQKYKLGEGAGNIC